MSEREGLPIEQVPIFDRDLPVEQLDKLVTDNGGESVVARELTTDHVYERCDCGAVPEHCGYRYALDDNGICGRVESEHGEELVIAV